MDDYYKLLNIDYDANLDEINNAYNLKMVDYKLASHVSDEDKEEIKKLKKAHHILNNNEYKVTYDKSIKNKINKDQTKEQNKMQTKDTNPLLNFDIKQTYNLNRKTDFNHNYISDRIFGLNHNNASTFVTDSESLRPQNAGLSSDFKPEFDTPLDFDKTADLQPFNFDS
jgi:DnaJ-class molecular chaperone